METGPTHQNHSSRRRRHHKDREWLEETEHTGALPGWTPLCLWQTCDQYRCISLVLVVLLTLVWVVVVVVFSRPFLRRWQMAQWWLWFRSKCLRTTSPTHSHLRAHSVDTVRSLLFSHQLPVWQILVFFSFYPSYAVLARNCLFSLIRLQLYWLKFSEKQHRSSQICVTRSIHSTWSLAQCNCTVFIAVQFSSFSPRKAVIEPKRVTKTWYHLKMAADGWAEAPVG